jgi:predicted RNA-binding Zn-ribbon protein involved in translation (DUF1610 family)
MPGEPRYMFGIKLTMPRWVASCPACGETIVRATITDSATLDIVRLDPYQINTKPTVPRGGVKQDCPACKRKMVIKSSDLSYSFL